MFKMKRLIDAEKIIKIRSKLFVLFVRILPKINSVFNFTFYRIFKFFKPTFNKKNYIRRRDSLIFAGNIKRCPTSFISKLSNGECKLFFSHRIHLIRSEEHTSELQS